jgi:hypothetical protein
MPYTREQWRNRIAERTDISSNVVHLTRNELIDGKMATSLAVLFKILCDKTLKGSSTATGLIVGDRRAVCFQESPLSAVTQNVYFEQKYREINTSAKVRYRANGLAFSKPLIYKSGGRPAIYENTEVAKRFLPKEEWWRIVRLDLSNSNAYIDWSHEREWRVPGDFNFKLSDAIVLLVNKIQYRKFIEMCEIKNRMDILREIKSIVVLDPILY